MRLMHKFRGQSRLRDLFQAVVNGMKLDLTPLDVMHLFEECDKNKDGRLSVKEMVQWGALAQEEAERLAKELDFFPKDGLLSLPELMVVVFEHSQDTFADQMKGIFTRSTLKGGERPAGGSDVTVAKARARVNRAKKKIREAED